MEAAENAYIQPALASRLFLICRWAEIERPDARVIGADPA